jgi:hypothetical protein
MCRLPLEGIRSVPSSKPAGRAAQQYDDEFLQFTYKVNVFPGTSQKCALGECKC